MKVLKAIAVLCAAATLISSTAFSACNVIPRPDDTPPLDQPTVPPADDEPAFTTYRQDLNYSESTEKINNPDQGFYRPVLVRMTDGGATYNKNIITDATQLYHLRIDISAFSSAVNGTADKPLSSAALNGLDELINYLKAKEKSAIVRLAYDPNYGGSANKEPALSVISEHIAQACKVFNRHKTTITAIEVGLLGPWGEMHTSAAATAENITKITEKYLSETSNLPVLVRTPKMIYNYLGLTLTEAQNYVIEKDSPAYRLGIFNDGYLGSSTDLGTYTDREKDIAFLKNQTEHLPYGGEVVTPSSTLHDIEVCTPEMFEMNLSYLNVEWNNLVIDKWKNSDYTAECGDEENYYGKTAFDYIQNRLGYRFVLKDSVLKTNAAGKVEISLKTHNVGFGNLNKEKSAELIFADANGTVAEIIKVENFRGSSELTYSFETNLNVTDFFIYLRLYGENIGGAPAYALQFANDGLWNEELKANLICIPVK